MPKEPNEEERQEVAEAKPDGHSEANKTGVAAICAAIVVICTLIATWAAATGHYTTLSVSIIVGIANVGLATWFGWPPKQIRRRTTDLLNKMATVLLHSAKPPTPDNSSIPPDKPSELEQFQAEHDRVAKELVRTKLEFERFRQEKEQGRYKTTGLQHSDSVDETPTEKLGEDKSRRSAGIQTNDKRPDKTASAEHAELILAQLAKQLEPRRIESAPSEKALRVLQTGPKGSVEIVYLGSDGEAWTLAIDFVHLMNRAGWNILDSPTGLATILALGAAPFGITIQARMIDGDSEDVRLYDTLVDAIAASGFSSAGGADPSLPTGRCRLIVGPKQPPRLEIETAAQRERTANAEKALLELQERTKHRKLTTAQRGQLIALLKRGPASSITVEGISGDSEVSGFGHELGSAVQEGGFNLIAYGTRTTAENFSGLKVLAVTFEDPAAIALHKSLNEVGLSASLELNPEHLVNPEMPKVPSWFFDENDPVDRMAKQMAEPCNVLLVGFKP